MSYDVDLLDPATGEVLPFSERFWDGGTFPLDGCVECSLNITYNYYKVFGALVRRLHDREASVTLPELTAFCDMWPDAQPSDDYWEPTPGNAKQAVDRLRQFAVAHPTGRWRVT